MIRIYTYEKCYTCRKALKFLAAHGVEAQVVPIREHPPSRAELKRMLGFVGGELRRLFNTSGRDYKALGLKDRLAKLSEADALNLLAKNGNLVKRPFLLAEKRGVVGFNETEWREFLRGASAWYVVGTFGSRSTHHALRFTFYASRRRSAC